MEDKLFINKRYVKNDNDKLEAFTVNNGVIKRIKVSFLTNKIIDEDNIWYLFKDINKEDQERLKDLTVTERELLEFNKSKRNDVYDSENVLIYVKNNTELLPIVGNMLPSDGINAYTVIEKEGKIMLKPIIICWNCHWADLFSGNTKYGMNVFCLASELTSEQRHMFESEGLIISLGNALDYLNEEKNKTL